MSGMGTNSGVLLRPRGAHADGNGPERLLTADPPGDDGILKATFSDPLVHQTWWRQP